MNKSIKPYPVSIKGGVLITALLVVAITVTLSTALLVMTKQFIKSSQIQLKDTQAHAYIDSALNWIKIELQEDRKLSLEKQPRFPINFQPAIIEQGLLKISIDDAQSKLNINNLAPNPDFNLYKKIWVTLLKEELNLADELCEDLTKKLSQLRQSQALLCVEELLKIPGFKKDYLIKLKPYIIALPQLTTVNINTVSPRLLSLIIQNPELVSSLLLEREKSLSQLPNRLLEQKPLESKAFGVNTNYFIATISLEIADYPLTEKVLLAGSEQSLRILMSVE